MFDSFDSKIRIRKRGREHPGEGANAIHGLRVRVRGVNFVPFPQQVDEVSTRAASGVQYSHSSGDAAFQKLVEKINVDLAELFLERERGHFYKPGFTNLVLQTWFSRAANADGCEKFERFVDGLEQHVMDSAQFSRSGSAHVLIDAYGQNQAVEGCPTIQELSGRKRVCRDRSSLSTVNAGFLRVTRIQDLALEPSKSMGINLKASVAFGLLAA